MAKTKTATTKVRANASRARAKRPESKMDKVVALLGRSGGATISQITEVTAWLPHTARAMLTGLRKKGFGLQKSKVDGTTHYQITAEPTA